jgi:hypothetical protein
MSQLEALAITLAVEAVVALAAMRLLRWTPSSWGRAIAVVCAASLLSHPLAWTANTVWLRPWPFELRAAAIESAVIVFEACVLAGGLALGWRRAFALAAAANLASFGLGLAIA